MDQSFEALSAADNSSAVGGASPLPQPMFFGFDDIMNQYFVVLPMNSIKHYNHEPVNRIIHHKILTALGDFDPNLFPPILESWGNPVSVCVKLTCTRKVFDELRAEILSVYTTFGGSPEMMLCYQTSGAM